VFPSILKAPAIVQPETVIRWHRAGFRCYWRWKPRARGGRPAIEADLRALIRQMSIDNPLWGAPRIHREVLKLGFEVVQSTVAKYMVMRCGPPSQEWRTFLHNHAPEIVAMDLFVVPTIGFSLPYAFVIVRLDCRALVWINVTQDPTAEWVARQLTEAFPWDEVPGYLIRDNEHLWQRRPAPHSCHKHPRQAHSAWVALAERLCRTADRIDPARVPRSPRRPGRGSATSDSAKLRRLLQQDQDAPVAGQRCTLLPFGSPRREHCVTRYSRRASPTLCSGLGFRYTQACITNMSGYDYWNGQRGVK
jgi:hypothetical protein